MTLYISNEPKIGKKWIIIYLCSECYEDFISGFDEKKYVIHELLRNALDKSYVLCECGNKADAKITIERRGIEK